MNRRCGLDVAALLAGVAAVAGTASAADDKAKAYGKHLSAECTACHRLDGVDNGIPSIVGWPEANFKSALEAFQSGARTNEVMVSVQAQMREEHSVAGLTEQINAVERAMKQAFPEVRWSFFEPDVARGD